jgi:PIN domain nuclease of toxin-antitoxin system
LSRAALLLDTCAAIWLAEDDGFAPAGRDALAVAAQEGLALYLSPITAWEIGLLLARGRLALPIDPKLWFDRLLNAPQVRLAELSPTILIDSSLLPGEPPRDPADRIMAATARAFGYRLLTRDRILLDYAARGHLDALAC